MLKPVKRLNNNSNTNQRVKNHFNAIGQNSIAEMSGNFKHVIWDMCPLKPYHCKITKTKNEIKQEMLMNQKKY